LIQTLIVCGLLFSTLAGVAETNVWMQTPGFTIREVPVKLSNYW